MISSMPFYTISQNVMVIRDTANVTIVDDDSGNEGSDDDNRCDDINNSTPN